jgi:hypothetical protein
MACMCGDSQCPDCGSAQGTLDDSVHFQKCPDGCECPECGEDNIDYLIIDEDSIVFCVTCENTYVLGGANTNANTE